MTVETEPSWFPAIFFLCDATLQKLSFTLRVINQITQAGGGGVIKPARLSL